MNGSCRRVSRYLIACAIAAIVFGIPTAGSAYICYRPSAHTNEVDGPGRTDAPAIDIEGRERCVPIGKEP